MLRAPTAASVQEGAREPSGAVVQEGAYYKGTLPGWGGRPGTLRSTGACGRARAPFAARAVCYRYQGAKYELGWYETREEAARVVDVLASEHAPAGAASPLRCVRQLACANPC